MSKPLEGILVIDMSQFLSGPSASLRLADLGARVIKIERKGSGDLCRNLYISNVEMNGESSMFQAINRNKESFEADLKNPTDNNAVFQLISKADVFIQNFRPGVIERLGFSYTALKAIKPDIIYAEISGYGKKGPWKDKPGQDLLVQARSGITALTGNQDSDPTPMGIAVADIFAGSHLTQGILAAIFQRDISGEGCKVEVSLLESVLDLQFEMITTFYQDGGQPTVRTKTNNAHAYLGAPYGIYKSQNGYLAIAMAFIPVLGDLLKCPALLVFENTQSWFDQRNEIKKILANHLLTQPTEHWLSKLEPADIWCAEVMNWHKLMQSEGFLSLDMLQKVQMTDGYVYETTRCPIRIDGALLTSTKGAPKLGEDTNVISQAFLAN